MSQDCLPTYGDLVATLRRLVTACSNNTAIARGAYPEDSDAFKEATAILGRLEEEPA